MTPAERVYEVAVGDLGPEHAREALSMVGDWIAQAGCRVVNQLPPETVAVASVSVTREVIEGSEEEIVEALEGLLGQMREGLLADVLAVKAAVAAHEFELAVGADEVEGAGA